MIADAYTDWYNQQQQLACDNGSLYFQKSLGCRSYPRFPTSALRTLLHGSGRTCDSAYAQDLLETYSPNQYKQYWCDPKINECHHLDTILLTPIESYQASTPVQQVSSTEKSKSLSCTVATCKAIITCPSDNTLKVLFNSGSTKTMIHQSTLLNKFQSTLLNKFQWILNVPSLRFQILGGKAK